MSCLEEVDSEAVVEVVALEVEVSVEFVVEEGGTAENEMK